MRMLLPMHDRSGGERPGDEHSDLFIVATIYLFVLVATIVVLVFQQASWAAGSIMEISGQVDQRRRTDLIRSFLT